MSNPAFSTGYKRYVLAMMAGVYTLNLVDRGLIMLLLQPIKTDLALTDAQLGLVTGIAFALFYAVAGLPIARWADRGNRVNIVALAIGLWGVTVMASIFVANFIQLLFARIAAAVGEAGCKPPTYALLGDYFPKPDERIWAMTIYWMGSPLSSLLSFILGGFLNELYGWRIAFFLMGIPGLALALLVRLTVSEPRTLVIAVADQPTFAQVLGVLWRGGCARHLSLALILLYLVSTGLAPWYAAFMIRSHGMGTQELGLWLGLIFGFSGMAGVFLGGYISGRWFAGNERGQMRLTAWVVASLVPCFLAFLLLPRKELALFALIPLMAVFCFFFAPSYALLQRLVPNNMRATVMAVVMLLANLIGMGIGPLIVGVLSDALRPVAGADSLRYAMLATSFVALWAGMHFWLAARSVGRDLAIASNSQIY